MAFRRSGRYRSEDKTTLEDGMREFPPLYAAFFCLACGAGALASGIAAFTTGSEGAQWAAFALVIGTAIASLVYIIGFFRAFILLDEVDEDIATGSPEMARILRMGWRVLIAAGAFVIALAALVLAGIR